MCAHGCHECLLMEFVFLGQILLGTTFPNSVADKLFRVIHITFVLYLVH